MHTNHHILWFIFYLLNFILALYFLLPVFFFLIHWFLPSHKKLMTSKYKKQTDKSFDFGAIITAHQDVRFIRPLVDSFCKQNYSNFMLYVIADDCDISNLYFADERVKLLKPIPSLHDKIKSINFGADHFVRPHDVLLIFDSDNLVHPDYFKNLNAYFQRGFKAVQTHMLSKNTGSTYAKLDSIGHIYYTFLERKIKMELGLSSAILGLGIAIEMELYKEIRYKETLGGFDKKLQVQLARKVKQIAFAEDAIVYDEKVEDGDTLEKQRTRWIYTYFQYYEDSFLLFARGIKNLNAGQLLLGFSMLRPPMFITAALACLITILCFLFKPVLGVYWLILIFCFILNFILIIATQSKQKGMLQSIIFIPMLVTRQIRSLLKIKSAKHNYLKTEHQKIVYIDELLKNELT